MYSAVKENEHDHKWSFSSHYHAGNSCFTLRFGSFIAYYKKTIYGLSLFYSAAAYNIVSPKNREMGSNGRTHTHRKHTAVSDIKSSSRHRVISLKLQPQRVGVGRQMGRTLSSREPPDDEGIIRLPILHRERIVWRLEVKVVKCQVDSGAWLWLDEPDAVHVVPIAFWVIWGEDSTWGSREIGHAGDCGGLQERRQSGGDRETDGDTDR